MIGLLIGALALPIFIVFFFPDSPTPYASGTISFADSNLVLTDVLGRSIAIRDRINSSIIACAPIVRAETLVLESPVLQIKQQSEFEDSTLSVLSNFNFPSGNPTVVILEDVLMTNSLCSGDAARVYNPYRVEVSQQAR